MGGGLQDSGGSERSAVISPRFRRMPYRIDDWIWGLY